LRQVLGVGTAVGQRTRKADDRHLVASNQIVKGLAAARSRLCDQLLVDVHSAIVPSAGGPAITCLDPPGHDFIPEEYRAH
jgi:hypothetical protein